jgi:hypothetical protein
MTAKEERQKQEVQEAERRRREREEHEKITPDERPDRGVNETGDGGAHRKELPTYPNKKSGI